MNLLLNLLIKIFKVQQKRPNQEPPIDLVEQFYKENVDLESYFECKKG